MRRFGVAVVALVAAAAATAGAAEKGNPVSLDSAQLRDFAGRYTAAWCSQDPARVASFFSPDGSLKVNDAAPAVGHEAITAVAKDFMTAFPDMKVLMDDVSGDGDRAVYRWTLVGTNTGPGGSGRGVRLSGYEEWRIGPDALIAESRGHFDAEDYKRQLEGGAKPKEQAGAGRSATAKETPADALKAKLDAGEKVLVIDVRSDEEVKSGSIPGAVHIPMEQLEARMKDIPKDVALVFT
jgi:SnoaL-like polyketide cyclase/Rhodanese-like domain